MFPARWNCRPLKKPVYAATLRFSTSSTLQANRVIYFERPGNPAEVLSALTYPSLSSPPMGSVNVRLRLSPINPSDVNVIEGVYPSKPSGRTSLTEGHILSNTIFVPGNEGLAEVVGVGSGVDGLSKGDWVVMAKQQIGTWASALTVPAEDVIKVPNSLSEVNAATITVNPTTAYNMLHDFVALKEGDWVMQNAANSAVGQAVIQIAARKGWKTLNFVRNRKDIDALKQHLTELGATQVLTYEDIGEQSIRNQVKKWTAGKPIRLMLNSVGGKPTQLMTRFLGVDSHLVSYGAMSKQPLSLPTSLFIFKNLTAHGFWQSQWYKVKGREEREALMSALADLKLQEPVHEILTLSKTDSNETVSERVKQVIQRMGEGQYGKKVLLKFEEPED